MFHVKHSRERLSLRGLCMVYSTLCEQLATPAHAYRSADESNWTASAFDLDRLQ